MFCDQCGAELESGQQFCSRCGKERQGLVLGAAPRAERVRKHVRLLAIFWLVLSALDAMSGLVVLMIGPRVFGHHMPGADVPSFVHPLATIAAIFSIVKAMFGFIAGWGLLNRQAWARSLAIVMAVISLFFSIPFGTALGVYTLWVLLPSQSREEYARYQRGE